MPITDNGITTRVQQLQIGDNSNGVLIKANSAGALVLRSVGDVAAAGLVIDDLTADELNTTNVVPGSSGTAGAATVSKTTYGDGRDFTTVLTLTDFVVGALPGTISNKAIGNKIFSFPAGVHLHFMTYMSVGLSAAGDAATPKIGIGSVIASGTVNTLAGSATFMDYITQQTATDITGTATVITLPATAGLLTGISKNVAGDVKDVFLNAAGGWVVNNAGNLTANGTITLRWSRLA